MRKNIQKIYEELEENAVHGDVPIDSIVKWIEAFAIPIQSFNVKHSSYGLKHIAEKCFGSYISNDDMKLAMLIAGYIPKDTNELNWNFCISEKSPMFIISPEKIYEFKKSKEEEQDVY